MAEARRVRLYWDDGTVETPHHPIDPGVTMIIRQAKDGTHRHFGVTDEIDGRWLFHRPRAARLRLAVPQRL